MSKFKRKNRTQESVKMRTVIFTLSSVMKMPEMVKKYRRTEVDALFAELFVKDYGTLIKGKRGRSNPTTFIANANCPDSYSMEFEYFRTRNSLPVQQEEANVDAVVENFESKIPTTPKTPESAPLNEKGGYILSFSDCYVFLDRASNAGFSSIEEAVSASWDKIEGFIPTHKMRHMTPIQQIASKLRGTGWVVLNQNK